HLAVAHGEVFGLVGESGSGKSTLLRALTGLVPLASGSLSIDGRPVGGTPDRAFRRHVQMVFQDPYASLNTRQTIAQIVATGPLAHGVGRRDAYRRAAELLAQVGLPPDALDRYPHEFSGGQRQRISLARALALDPSILVADEMVSGLDVS
ncbi:ABC transporter ATP-binding protein, partial [Mycobacterium tuberculosis]|nr:ABC transporter ATP-binding protein [Mycobacterium tuberculosis]